MLKFGAGLALRRHFFVRDLSDRLKEANKSFICKAAVFVGYLGDVICWLLLLPPSRWIRCLSRLD